MLEQKGAKLTVTETDDIIFKYNTFSQNDYVQFMGKSVNLGRLTYANGQHETNCFTTPEYKEEATKLYEEMVRKRVQESKEFYDRHRWL